MVDVMRLVFYKNSESEEIFKGKIDQFFKYCFDDETAFKSIVLYLKLFVSEMQDCKVPKRIAR